MSKLGSFMTIRTVALVSVLLSAPAAHAVLMRVDYTGVVVGPVIGPLALEFSDGDPIAGTFFYDTALAGPNLSGLPEIASYRPMTHDFIITDRSPVTGLLPAMDEVGFYDDWNGIDRLEVSDFEFLNNDNFNFVLLSAGGSEVSSFDFIDGLGIDQERTIDFTSASPRDVLTRGLFQSYIDGEVVEFLDWRIHTITFRREAIPEPSTLALLCVGLGLCLARRRSR